MIKHHHGPLLNNGANISFAVDVEEVVVEETFQKEKHFTKVASQPTAFSSHGSATALFPFPFLFFARLHVIIGTRLKNWVHDCER